MSYKVYNQFGSVDALHQALIQRIEKNLLDAIAEKGKAFIALSGGSTPKRLFEKLCLLDIPWNRVVITLVDERWTDLNSSESNEFLVRHTLLKEKAAVARFIGLKNRFATASEGEEACNQTFSDLDENFDLVMLGMGEDGHTASFFPDASALQKALSTEASCVAITPPVAPYERMTLSLSRLIRTDNLILHIEGEKKWKVFEAAVQAGPVEAMPVRAFIYRSETPLLEVYHG